MELYPDLEPRALTREEKQYIRAKLDNNLLKNEHSTWTKGTNGAGYPVTRLGARFAGAILDPFL